MVPFLNKSVELITGIIDLLLAIPSVKADTFPTSSNTFLLELINDLLAPLVFKLIVACFAICCKLRGVVDLVNFSNFSIFLRDFSISDIPDTAPFVNLVISVETSIPFIVFWISDTISVVFNRADAILAPD